MMVCVDEGERVRVGERAREGGDASGDGWSVNLWCVVNNLDVNDVVMV